MRTKSPLPSSPLRTGETFLSVSSSATYHLVQLSFASVTAFPHLSPSGTSSTSAVCCQVPSKWTAVLCSSNRSSFHRYQTFRREEVSFIETDVVLFHSFEKSTESVLHCSRETHMKRFFANLTVFLLIFFLYLQVSIHSWKSTNLYSSSTLQASSKYMATLFSAHLPWGSLFLLLSNWHMLSIQAAVCV